RLKQWVGLNDRTQQAATRAGIRTAQERKRTTLAASAIDLPADHIVRLSERNELACLRTDQRRVQCPLGRSIVDHRLTEPDKVACVERIARPLRRISQGR